MRSLNFSGFQITSACSFNLLKSGHHVPGMFSKVDILYLVPCVVLQGYIACENELP